MITLHATDAADSAKPADEAYLDALQGTWLMEGTVRGKSVHYVAHWLDRFGAAGARVVARGGRRGQQLVRLVRSPHR
jgi:hypothetical protein